VARTTLNLDDPVLADLKRLQRKEHKPLGELASELLATAIAARRKPSATVARLHWTSRPMGASVDLSDKHALFAAMDSADTKLHRKK
jgi:hypothetical protein